MELPGTDIQATCRCHFVHGRLSPESSSALSAAAKIGDGYDGERRCTARFCRTPDDESFLRSEGKFGV